MENPRNEFDLCALLHLLGKRTNLDIILALGNRKMTLPGLCKKLGRSKPLACMYLGGLHDLEIVGKGLENGKMRYWLKARGMLSLLRKAQKTLDSYRASLGGEGGIQ